MSVSVVCPACDMELSCDTPGVTIQCRTCWAKVPVPAVATDTPPPQGGGPTVLSVAPPRAKRVAEPARERSPRQRREEKPANWVGAAVLLVALLAGGGALLAFLWPSAEPDAVVTTPTTKKVSPPTPDADWHQRDTGDGARVLAPGPLEANTIAVRQGTLLRTGTQYTASDPSGNVGEVFCFQHENGDQRERVASFMEVPAGYAVRVGKRSVRGGEATEYSATNDGYEHTVLVVGRNEEWCLFHLKLKVDGEGNSGRREEFMANAEVTWTRRQDPKPAPKQPKKPTR